MGGSKKCLLLVSEPDSYRLAPYIFAARRMGLEVLVASRGRHSLVSEVAHGLHVNLADRESALQTILVQARDIPFAGVVGSDDSTVELASLVAGELGLPHNPPRAARLSRRKDLARTHLLEAGCQVPRHRVIDLDQSLDQIAHHIDYPCVVKPLAFSGSRGVIRADNEPEFIKACQRIQPLLRSVDDPYERRHLLIEDYVDGIELAFEGFLHEGELNTLAVFDKPDPLTGPFFEETIYVTPSKLDTAVLKQVKEEISRACRAYGLTTGPIHAELRVDGSWTWILEVAARTIGGDCARALDVEHGFNLEELVIALAVGHKVEMTPPPGARGVMMIPVSDRGVLRRVEGLSRALSVPLVESIEIAVRTGYELVPLPEGSRYPGFIFARGETPDQVVAALREAHDHLDFVVAPVLNTRVAC